MTTVDLVVGGQFGSEGKGAFTYGLAKRYVDRGFDPIVVRTGGPNAGHTVWRKGTEWKLRQIPAGMLVNDTVIGCVAAGAEVDEEVLVNEIRMLEEAGIPIEDRLIVDREATLIMPHHRRQEEELVGAIGSTGKGVGAARAERIMRGAQVYGDRGQERVLDAISLHHSPVIVEGTQGYGLGLHAGFYPKCTSRDVRGIDLLAEVGIPPHLPWEFRTWVVYRPNPIRVAGDSGPLVGETSWEALGLPEERTTVTNKVRRVGAWDPDVVRSAIVANGGNQSMAVHMFLDYQFPELFGKTRWEDVVRVHGAMRYINSIDSQIGTATLAFGTGPDSLIWR